MSTTLAHEAKVEKQRYAGELLRAIDASGYHERRDTENHGVSIVVRAGLSLSLGKSSTQALSAHKALDRPERTTPSKPLQEILDQIRAELLVEIDPVKSELLLQIAHEIGHCSLAWGHNSELDSFILHMSRDSVRDLRRWVNALKLKMPTISVVNRPQRRRKILRSPSQMRVTGLKEAA